MAGHDGAGIRERESSILYPRKIRHRAGGGADFVEQLQAILAQICVVVVFSKGKILAGPLGAVGRIFAVVGAEELAERLDPADHHQETALALQGKHGVAEVVGCALFGELDFRRSAKKERSSTMGFLS